MARPSKYNWEAIQEAYEIGFNRDEICRKFKIDAKLLSNRLNQEQWQVKGSLRNDLKGLSENIEKTSLNITKLKNDAVQDLAVEVFSTMNEDQELMTNNRKIAKLLQSIIVANRQNIDLTNIRQVAGTIKDIEAIANPQASKQEINIQNTNAVQNNIKTLDDFYDN